MKNSKLILSLFTTIICCSISRAQTTQRQGNEAANKTELPMKIKNEMPMSLRNTSTNDIRKGWDGTVKGQKTPMAFLMGQPQDCTGTGACHNQIYAIEKKRELADKEVVIQFVQEGDQIMGIYLTQAPAKSKVFVTSEPILIEKKHIENGKSAFTILPTSHKTDESLGEFGGVRFSTKVN